MLQNKEIIVQIKKKYKNFTTDSVLSLTMQVSTPHCNDTKYTYKYIKPYVNSLENTTAKLLNTIFNSKAVGYEVSISIQ